MSAAPGSATAPTAFDITGPLPLRSTTLLEASAGTGKTWTIGALVARYLAEGAADLDEMLIITFGRAASQELRERVRAHLRMVHGALADPHLPGDDPVVALIRGRGEEAVGEAERRLRQALTDFDGATIATTHQFCQIVLRSLGVAGDTDASARLVEDLSGLQDEVVADLYLSDITLPAGGEAPPFSAEAAAALAELALADPHAALVPHPDAPDLSDHDRLRLRFAHRVRAEMAARKDRLSVLGFDDLLSHLADSVEAEDAPARARMRARWSIVLVDEFQDTDPVQWQVIDRAFSGHGTVVLIGDPKQAIYGFRGGDVDTYLRAAATAQHRHTLAVNHRSDPGVVAAVNVMMRGAELGDPDIVVHPIEANRTESRLGRNGDAAPLPPVRLRMLPHSLAQDDDGAMRIDHVRRLIARDCAQDIARLLEAGVTFEERAVQAGDIAVLAHSNAELGHVQAALADHGLRSVLVATDSVYQSPAATDWLVLLEALEAPHRAGRVRSAALTPFIGDDLSALDEGGDARTEQLAAQLRSWADLVERRGVAAVLAAAVAGGLDARVLGVSGGPRTLTDLRHVAEILHQRVVEHGEGLSALTTWLRQRMAQPHGEERSRRLESDADAVHLSTIHGSKGLQYPIVYVPFVSSRWSPSPSERRRDGSYPPLLFHDRGTRERSLDIGIASDPGRPGREEAWREEDLGESMRLLYVALTRAQSHLVTWWFPSERNTGSAPLHRLLFGRHPDTGPASAPAPIPGEQTAWAVLSGWRDAGGARLERVDERPVALLGGSGPALDLRVREFTRDVDTEWRRTSYTALTRASDAHGSGPGGTAPGGGSPGGGSSGDRTPGGGSPGGAGLRDAWVGSEIEDAPRDDDEGSPGAGGPASARAPRTSQLASPMADLPVGATFGSLVHAVLEHADPESADLRDELRGLVARESLHWPVPALDSDALADALVSVCDTPLGPLAGGLTLRQVPLRDRLREMEFEIPLVGGDLSDAREVVRLGDLAPLLEQHLTDGDPVRQWAAALADPLLGDQPLRGYLTGSVDVALRVGERYLVVDYKTNWLGAPDEPLTTADYDPDSLHQAMSHSSYPLQALLYAVVLHRFLRWRLADYDPDRHLGGVLYLYVRGMAGPETPVTDGHPSGVFSWRPPTSLVVAVSDLLAGAGGSAP